MRLARLILPILAALATPVAAAPCTEVVGEARVIGHDGYASLTLEDGREVRLADIVPATAVAPQAGADALAPLIGTLIGTEVTVRRVAADIPNDRYGRIVGDVVPKATRGVLSQQLLREGLALVDPAVMSQTCLDELFAAEREAEQARRGLWRGTLVRSADDPDLADASGHFGLVVGAVKSVGETRETIYLNFGADYRTDFTALIRREDAKGWADTLMALEGRNVRIRGVLEAWNGGLIRVQHLRQIELLPNGQSG